MSKPKAYGRLVSELPFYNGTYTDNKGNLSNSATYVWVDEGGNPIATSDLLNYDTSNKSKWNPSLKSTGQDLLEKADAEMIRLRNADEHVSENYGGRAWGKVGALMGGTGLVIASGMYTFPWLALNAPYLSARGWLGATLATGATPTWLTPTTATAIDATLAGSATGASINDMRENGPTVGNVLGTALGVGGLVYEAAPTLMEGYTAARNAVRPTIVGMKMRTMPLGEVETPTLTPQMRYRLGDVEINDPNLNYRQGARGTADDFLLSGKVRVKYEGADAAKRERKPGRFLLTKSFNNPMFKLGGLWYDGWLMNEPGATPGMPDLLVTRQPLRFATKGAGPAKADLGGRRIPFSEDLLGIGNTSAYSWLDGYGFRRITPGTAELPKDAWDQAVTAVLNKPFIEAYNQWNRFGYPQVPKGMASDTPRLEAFVRGQLNRHNTFSRGVQVMPSDKTALEFLLGRRLTDDEFLRIAATTPRMEGDVGQPGLWISPRTDYTSIYGGGKTALVRRPFKLGPDRMKWFDEASFNVQHNPGAEGSYTEIMAPWNTKPVLNWNGVPKYSVGTIPETELLSPIRMEFVDFVKGSPHMNNRTSLNSNPFFTKGENRFDPESGLWIINTFKKGGKLRKFGYDKIIKRT